MEAVGYLLPIRPIQSEQYANRLSMEPYNFATVGRLQSIKLKSDFLEEFEEVLHLLDEDEDKKKDKKNDRELAYADYPPRISEAYAPPNPVNLSPAISQIVGKGISVNTYI